jgi:hypothetical protein
MIVSMKCAELLHCYKFIIVCIKELTYVQQSLYLLRPDRRLGGRRNCAVLDLSKAFDCIQQNIFMDEIWINKNAP